MSKSAYKLLFYVFASWSSLYKKNYTFVIAQHFINRPILLWYKFFSRSLLEGSVDQLPWIQNDFEL